MASNKFRKALRHLKSTELDEKILSLNEAPTNSMGGVYALNQPGHRLGPQDPAKVFYPDVDGNWPSGIPGTPGEKVYVRPAGYWETGPGSVPSIDWDFQVDLSHSDTSTDGFIDSSTGQVLVPLPPNSDHFILGPLVDGYTYNHGYDDFTTIGYIQKDTRQLVVLATIPGYWKSGESGIRGSGVTNREWDGSTINIVNPSFTLEMAEWFRDRYNEGKYVNKVSYFYSGGQPQAGNSDPGAPAGTKGGVVPGVGDGSVASASGPQGTGTSNGDPRIGTQQNAANHGGPEDAELYYTQQDPKVFANMTAGELAELGLNLLNIGLDIAAIAGIIFPEPGTSAAGLARLATRLGQRAGSRAMNSARNRALRGALNPFGQRAVRAGAAGRKRVPVYSGRPYKGKRGFGKTTYGTTDPKTAATYSNPGPLKGTPGTGGRVNPKGTVDQGTLPQRYIDKYGSRSVLGQRQIKLGQKAAKRTFGEQFLLEVATATPTVTTAPTQEQITKTNQTADQTADAIANSISQDQTADLAVKAEGDAILIAANDPAVQEALDRATKYGPQSLTAEQKQILINNGYDDFVRGGMQGTDWLGDLLTLGLSAAAAYVLWPVLVKVGGSFVSLIKTEHGMRALTDSAYKTFQTTGQMPPWYHWAFWKLLPQPMLNAFARIAGTVPAKSLLATEGTAAGKIGLHYILKPAALTSFFQLLIKGDQRGAEKLLETSITDAVKQDIESQNYDLLMAMWDSVGEETFLKLTDVYGDQKEGFNEKNDRLEELYDPEYIKGIRNEIKEIEVNYKGGSWEENGVRIYARSDWGGQFTKKNFESSGQSFEEYDALREQIGFFNGERGPDEYGRYMPVGWWQIMDAKKNGHKPEQFTGIAYEIVSRSYKMDEIMKNPNYPREGRNIYNNEEDYLEASKLQDEYQKILGEYINLWEGPGGYDELSNKAWDFDRRSQKMMAEDAREASKRKQELESQIKNVIKEREELADEVFELYDEIYTEMLVDYLLEPPETKYPTDVSYNPQQNNQEIAGLRPDGTQGQNKVGDTNRGHDGTLYKLVPRPGYGYNMWVPVKHAKKDDPNTPLGTTDPTTLATTGYATRKRKKKNDEEELFASYKNSGVVLSEERKRILREIKQPYKLPEQPKQKYKMNFKGKFTAQNTPDVTASKQSDAILTAKNSAGQTWRAQDKHWSRYESTERMNIIYDNIGHGSQYFDMIVNENQGKKGWRNREIQEQLNLISHHAYEKSMEQIIEQQTLDAPNDPLFKKVADKLRKQIDYPDKPAKAGYPNNPPPEMVNGKHPEYGQKSDYYKRLDPHSAEAMPPTGNPEIDANVQKARRAKKLKESKNYKSGKKTLKKFNESNWRRENLREFGEWAPIETSGPTNSTSTTFGYFAGGSPVINGETGQQVTFTYSGLNGSENYPTSVTIDQGFGDTFDTAPPPFSQVGVQGYTAKLNPRYAEAQKKYEEELKEWERKKEQQQKDIEATLKSFGTSYRDVQRDGGITKVGNSYVAIIPTNTRDFGSNLLNNVRVVRLVPCDPSQPMKLTKNVRDISGTKKWNVSNAQYSDDVYLQIGEQPKAPMEQEYLMPRRLDYKDVNPQLDASQEFAQKVGADYMMGARVQSPNTPTDLLSQLANTFGVGTAKRVFDYHVNWNKTKNSKPQNLTNLLSPEDKQLLQDLVNKHASNATDELRQLGINSELQHTIGRSGGLRNSLGVMDWDRGDGARIEGNTVVIRKAYDFEGFDDIGGATGVTGIPAGLYAMSKGVFGKTGTMNMEIRIPIVRTKRKKKGREERVDG